MNARLSAVPAPGRAGTAAPTSERDRGMDNETTKAAWKLDPGEIITRHPNQPHQAGTWTVTGRPKMVHTVATIPVSMLDGGEDVFVVDMVAPITLRASKTYTLTARLNADDREHALQELSADECRFLAGALMQGYPEIFDAEVALLDRPGVRDSLAKPASTTARGPA